MNAARLFLVAFALVAGGCSSDREARDASVDAGDVAVDQAIDVARSDVGDDAMDLPASLVVHACGRDITVSGIACNDQTSHIDCFGGGVCRDGVAWRNAFAPLPTPNVCDLNVPDLEHVCCTEAVVCQRGCAPDWPDRAATLGDRAAFDPHLLCAEAAWGCADAGGAPCDGSVDAGDAR